MVRRVTPLLLRQDDADELVRLTRSSSGSAELAARARIVLLAADGTSNVQIAELVGVSRPTVAQRAPHDGRSACSARRSPCVLRTTVALCVLRTTVPLCLSSSGRCGRRVGAGGLGK